MKSSQKLRALGLVEGTLKPALYEAMTNAAPNLDSRFDLKLVENNLTWNLIISRKFITDTAGERPVPFSDKIIGGECVFAVVFKPESYAPELATIACQWQDSALTWDPAQWHHIINKYVCNKCQKIKGHSCECVKSAIDTINIGSIERGLEEKLDDVAAGLKSLKFAERKTSLVIDEIKKQATGIESFEQLFRLALRLASK